MITFKQVKQSVKKSKIWKSIFRHDFSDTPRTRLVRVFGNVFLHLHPVRIAKDAIRYTYTWGLGGISFYLFMILLVTGILLMFYYRPTSMLAYQDIKDLSFVVTLGSLLRNMHRWSAHLMVVTVMFHMIRVFLTGAYKPPREFNWVVGVILLVLTLFLSYTGYLLPWDQLALWAVTVGAQMAANTPVIGNEGPFRLPFITTANDARFGLIGGTVIGDATLIRFYVLHCVAIPFIFSVFLVVHFWRVRKDTFSVQSGPKVDVWSHFVSREFLAAMLITVILFVWSLVMNAPLEGVADLNVTPNPSKAPWYFLGLQELLVYFDPWIAGVLLPGIIIFGLMAIPYIDTNSRGVGVWPRMRRGRFGILVPSERPIAITLFMLGIFMWFLLIFVGTFCRGPNWEWYWPWEPWSHRRLTKLVLKNLPNLWGLILLNSYFLMATPFSNKVREVINTKFGSLSPDRVAKLFHMGLGYLMAISVCVPILIAPDLDYPIRSSYTTLFESLGRSSNAPVIQLMYGTVSAFGSLLGFSIIALAIAIFGYILGRISCLFIKLKDGLYDEVGLIKYSIFMMLTLLMCGVIGKIILRMLFGIKYIISFPNFNLNI